MSASDSHTLDDLPLDVLEQINRVCEQFERAWQAGGSPSLNEFLEQVPHSGRPVCLRELLGLELEYRHSRQELLLLEDYLRRYPAEPDTVRLAWDDWQSEEGTAAHSIPAQFGDYRILREIGRGGMGIVFLAEQTSLDRQVAIKVLSPSMVLDPARRERFQREARATAALQHANIVPIYGVGCTGRFHYYVMRFVDGQGLDQIVRQLAQAKAEGTAIPHSLRPLPGLSTTEHEEPVSRSDALHGQATTESLVTENGRTEIHDHHYFRYVAEIILQAAKGLAHAHREGILHRDIKPSNLLLDRDGKLWIADFGLSKSIFDSQALTDTGDFAGSLKYMSPESFKGKADFRSDIYGLGLTFYELLTWQSPYEESDRAGLIEQVLHGGVPPLPRKINPRIPRDLETICLKCLCRDPGQRYASADEVAADLSRYLRDEPIRARPSPFWTKARLWARRQPYIAGLATIALLMTLGAFAALTWGIFATGRRAEAERDRARDQARHLWAEQQRVSDARQGREREALLRNNAEISLYFSRIALAERSWAAGEVAAAQRYLELCLPRPGGDDLRDWEWDYLNGLCHTETHVFTHAFWAHDIAFHPDREWLAVAVGSPGKGIGNSQRDSELVIWNVNTGQRVATLISAEQPVAAMRSVAFSGDGRWLVAADADGNWQVWDCQTWTPSAPIAAMAAICLPERDTLAVIGWEGELLHYQLPAGTEPVQIRGPVSGFPSRRSGCFSMDGRFAAIRAYDDSRVAIVDAATGEEVAVESVPTPGPLALSPGGRHLVDAERHYDVSSGLNLGALPHPGQVSIHLATFSPDHRWLSWTTPPWNELCIARTDGPLAPSYFQGHSGEITHSVYSPDSRRIATGSADHSVRIWSVSGEQQLVLRGHTSGVRAVAFSPDGQWIASAGQDRTVRVWNANRNPSLTTLGSDLGFGERVSAIAFAENGSQMLVARHGGVYGYDVATNRQVFSWQYDLLPSLEVPRGDARFAAQGRLLIAVPAAAPRLVEVWDLARLRQLDQTGRSPPPSSGLRLKLEGHTLNVQHVAANDSGSRFASLAFDPADQTTAELRVWDEKGQGRGWSTVAGSCLTLSSTGRLVAAGGQDGQVRIWDARSGALVGQWASPDPNFTCLAFSPDDQSLATATMKLVLVWDTSGNLQFKLMPSSERLSCLTFSPSGKRLATIGIDEGVVRLWDAATGESVITLRGQTQARPNAYGFFANVVFSPDGQRIAANHWNANISVWDAPPRTLTTPGPTQTKTPAAPPEKDSLE